MLLLKRSINSPWLISPVWSESNLNFKGGIFVSLSLREETLSGVRDFNCFTGTVCEPNWTLRVSWVRCGDSLVGSSRSLAIGVIENFEVKSREARRLSRVEESYSSYDIPTSLAHLIFSSTFCFYSLCSFTSTYLCISSSFFIYILYMRLLTPSYYSENIFFKGFCFPFLT
jgi:hypothetical protein